MRRARIAALAAVVPLVLSGPADGATYVVGLRAGVDAARAAKALERVTGSPAERVGPLPALVVRADAPDRLRALPAVRYVERLRERRLAYVPSDPFVPRQWYLTHSRFYEPWLALPVLPPVRVAVIDSGVDATHPELAGKIVAARSFVGGSAKVDALGHGTFVAGLIAAGVDNGVGIAGLAPSAELLVAKVVTRSRSIPVRAEAEAIAWAVDNGARVVNMSLGGVRDPLDPERDTFSQLEADAVAYAVSRGAVVVAAVGNSHLPGQAPWRYASYPAALPHVLGVSAIGESGAVPRFSNRDPVFNDIAAPGERILSLLPRPLTARFPACVEQGYSSCGPEEYRETQGTSFAAPQVSAAAAVIRALRPRLAPEQVRAIVTRSAVDQTPATGCGGCAPGRDALTGWGRLDVAAAIAALVQPLPPRDRFEANDDVGPRAQRIRGDERRLFASVDFWDDQDDVYAIHLERGQGVYVGLAAPGSSATLSLALWRPGTPSIRGVGAPSFRAALSARGGPRQYLAYRARERGTHFVHVRIPLPGATGYRLTIVKGQ
ncbi:MAG: S8 family serine peptidase [Thermoleophilia bacterium]|nr:S8 family serine peptidase [Thermoleophilia bacterium]